jgi:hypothetical protein
VPSKTGDIVQFIIVADVEVEALGRELAHALSLQDRHDAALWSVKHYKDNEAQVVGKQAVIFLGDSEVAKSYAAFLPERFSAFGTKCAVGGSKAVLIAEDPNSVGLSDLRRLRRVVAKQRLEFRDGVEIEATHGTGDEAHAHNTSAQAGPSDMSPPEGRIDATSVSTLVSTGAAVGIALESAQNAGNRLAWVIKRRLGERKRRKDYRQLQYGYLVTRFLGDEFDDYINGVERG